MKSIIRHPVNNEFKFKTKYFTRWFVNAMIAFALINYIFIKQHSTFQPFHRIILNFTKIRNCLEKIIVSCALKIVALIMDIV